MLKRLAPVLLLAATSVLLAGEKDTPAANKPKYGFNDVEVRLLDGSRLRGEIAGLDKLTAQTAFGTLTIPVSEMLSVKRDTQSGGPADAKELAAALKNLGQEDAALRAEAVRTLQNAGASAVDALFDARQKAAGETRARIDALLKSALAQRGGGGLTGDEIKAAKFTGRGTLQAPELTLKSKLGGLKLKMTDVAAIQWLAAGALQASELSAPAAFRDWTDTGVDIGQGETAAVLVSGLASWNNNSFGPGGSTNWSAQPYRAGAVVGKIGANGEQFLIGNKKCWTSAIGGRLFVKMYASDELLQRNDTEQTIGNFKVRIATGARRDELEGE